MRIKRNLLLILSLVIFTGISTYSFAGNASFVASQRSSFLARLLGLGTGDTVLNPDTPENGFYVQQSETSAGDVYISERSTYRFGKLLGTRKRYYSNGRLRSRGIYSDDKPNGLQKNYYDTGPLMNTEYYLNFQLIRVVCFKDGETKILNDNGIKIFQASGDVQDCSW